MSDHEDLLRILDNDAEQYGSTPAEDAAAAIRKLEAEAAAAEAAVQEVGTMLDWMTNDRDRISAELQALREANERLRGFAQHILSTPTPISRFRMNLTMRSIGLLDDRNNPTAVLTGESTSQAILDDSQPLPAPPEAKESPH